MCLEADMDHVMKKVEDERKCRVLNWTSPDTSRDCEVDLKSSQVGTGNSDNKHDKDGNDGVDDDGVDGDKNDDKDGGNNRVTMRTTTN